MDVALNNLERLICHKNQTTNQPNQTLVKGHLLKLVWRTVSFIYLYFKFDYNSLSFTVLPNYIRLCANLFKNWSFYGQMVSFINLFFFLISVSNFPRLTTVPAFIFASPYKPFIEMVIVCHFCVLRTILTIKFYTPIKSNYVNNR